MAPPEFGKGFGKEEREARWQTPRPDYMREAEPLAHPAAWPSMSPAAPADEREQALNRELFAQRGRKRYAASIDEVRQKAPAKRYQIEG